MPRYITCITRMMLNAGIIPGKGNCKGMEKLVDTHCQFCDHYIGNDPEYETEDPVIFEHETLEWEEEDTNEQV